MNSQTNKEEFPAKALQAFSRMLRESGPYITASYTLMGAVLGLGLLGYILDGWLNTGPWLLLGGTLLGLVVGFYEMARIVLKK